MHQIELQTDSWVEICSASKASHRALTVFVIIYDIYGSKNTLTDKYTATTVRYVSIALTPYTYSGT